LRQTFVHRIHRQRRGFKKIPVLEQRNVRLVRDAAHQKAVRRLFLRDNRQRFLIKLGDELRHFLLPAVFRIARLDRWNGKAFTVRVGIGQQAFQSFAAEHHDEAMFLAWFDDDFRVADFFHLGGEHRAKFLASLGRDAAGAAVGDDAFGIERAEVRARGYIAVLEFHAESERFDDAAANLEFQRVVAEKSEVSRPAAGRDAGRDRNHPALRGVFGERVEVRGRSRFQGREIILSPRRQIAETVEHNQREFCAGLQCQFRIESVQVHSSIFISKRYP